MHPSAHILPASSSLQCSCGSFVLKCGEEWQLYEVGAWSGKAVVKDFVCGRTHGVGVSVKTPIECARSLEG